jgi:hypothetical protein
MCTITLNIYAKQLWFLAYVVNIEQFPSDLDVNDPPPNPFSCPVCHQTPTQAIRIFS